MRAFLLRLTRFGALAAFAALASFALNRALFRFHVPPWEEPVRTLVLGDSNVESSLDPGGLPAAVSLAKGAEPLVVTYHKLRAFAGRIESGGAVVLGINPHNVGRSVDLQMARPPTREEFFARYYGLVPWLEIEGVDVVGGPLLVATARAWAVPNPHLAGDAVAWLSGGPREHDYAFGYRSEDLPKALLPEALESVTRSHFPPGLDPAWSDLQIDHARRIADLTSEAGLTLVLYSAPLHPRYVERIPPAVLERFDRLVSGLAGRPDVVRLDLMETPLPEDLYRDFNHVTVAGSRLTTRRLAEVLCALPGHAEEPPCR